MTHFVPFAVLAVLLLTQVGGFAQKKLTPTTFLRDREYVVEQTQHMEMDGKGLGMPGNIVTDMTMVTTARCTRHPDNRSHRLVESSVTSIKMDMDAGVMKMTYDSTQPDAEQTMLGQQMHKMIGLSFSFVLDENDQVISTEGLDGALGDTPMAQGMNREQLEQILMPSLNLGIPEEGVEIGGTWQNNMDINMEQMGQMEAAQEMTYVRDDEDGKIAVIEYEGELNMDLNATEGTAQATNAKLNASSMEGSIEIDKELRMVRKSTMTTEMDLEMQSPLTPGTTISMPIKQDVEVRLVSVTKL